MRTQTIPQKRATIYLDPALHRALKIKAADVSSTISDLINLAVRDSLSEDQQDLAAFEERKNDPLISYESMLKELKKNGKI